MITAKRFAIFAILAVSVLVATVYSTSSANTSPQAYNGPPITLTSNEICQMMQTSHVATTEMLLTPNLNYRYCSARDRRALVVIYEDGVSKTALQAYEEGLQRDTAFAGQGKKYGPFNREPEGIYVSGISEAYVTYNLQQSTGYDGAWIVDGMTFFYEVSNDPSLQPGMLITKITDAIGVGTK